MEALFKMGEGEYAMERCKRRFSEMVNHPDYTTLFEGWEIGSSKYVAQPIMHGAEEQLQSSVQNSAVSSLLSLDIRSLK